MAQGLRLATTGHLADHNTTGNDRQVGCQRTPGTEAPQRRKVVGQQGQKHLRTQVVDVVGCQPDAAGMGRVIDHVHEQTDESVHEITPGARVMLQATGQQTAVDFCQCQRITRRQAGEAGKMTRTPPAETVVRAQT